MNKKGVCVIRFIVIYDIPVEFDPIRKKISDILLSYYLIRLNYSVFFGELTYNKAEEVALKLEKVMKNVPGDVRIIPICKSCHSKVITIKSKFGDGYKVIEDILSM
ncbi:MAG: CRISPR-associated endonuclease Cas2 [Candidatus Lokiarchaeota archaeon]|nr:CRISPR-associated endonuclease Cas2 [Candidatus Lokiarchaeota archaeon]MBD3202445.1 CRISPR-associated endonuclease Cas2 [Candidatus Lokiarchaeota archaeon]